MDTGSRDAPETIYEDVRRRILAGELGAGSEVAQAHLSAEYGVSRGPVREALRLLQREGLIDSHVNLRATVTALSVEEVDHLYALRVTNECLALSVSLPSLNDEDLDELARLSCSIAGSAAAGFPEWEAQHERFHRLLLLNSGERLVSTLTQWAQHTERYRRVYVGDDLGGALAGGPEHAQLARLCRARDVTGAVDLLARHLSRAGLTLVAVMDPTYPPRLLRAAVDQVTRPPRSDPVR